MPPKAKKTKKELEEEKSKYLSSLYLPFNEIEFWILTINFPCDIEKLEEEKRIQEELERKRAE